MAQLTLCFKKKSLDVFQLDKNINTIGRESDNDFIIDSLAVACKQLSVSVSNHRYMVENLSEQFPVHLNGDLITKQYLHDGDKISLSKHELIFSETNINNLANNTGDDAKPAVTSQNKTNTVASLQIIRGKDIGLVISLDQETTEIVVAGQVPANIIKNNKGHFVSRLIDSADIKVAGDILDKEQALNDGDTIDIANIQFYYFIE